MTKTHQAVNWNRKTDDYTLQFLDQNISQFWIEKEIVLSGDKGVWKTLSPDEQETYNQTLGGLTLLDTKQANRGMPLIGLHIDNDQKGAVISFMGAMEHIHAKSYSSIFTTFCSEVKIDKIFDWVQNHKNLQYKADKVSSFYECLFKPKVTSTEMYKAMVASVLLESFLFYSGFYYPLFLAGQGKMTASGEIINLIIRDESIHGVFIGIEAQNILSTIEPKQQEELKLWAYDLLMDLYQNELEYTDDVYTKVGQAENVKGFLRYNANKAFDNLGLERPFEDEEINPVVKNGLDTSTKNHDFFSVKGNGYSKAMNVTPVTDDSFKFNWLGDK